MDALRKPEFDIAKAIAIFMVVFGHVYNSLFGLHSILIDFCHMPVFFFISGYFLQGSIERQSFKDFCIRKTRSLLIPYICWSLVSFITNIVLKYIQHGTELGIKEIVDEGIYIFFYSRSVWFFIELYAASIFLISFYKIANRFRINRYICWLTGWFLLSIIIPGEPFAFFKYKWLFPFMIAGVFCADKKLNKYLNKLAAIASVSVFIFASEILYHESYFSVYGTFGYSTLKETGFGLLYYVISLLGVISIIGISANIRNGMVEKLFVYVGRYSMDIYVIHMFFIRFHFWRLPLTNEWFAIFYTFLYSVIVVVTILIMREKILRHFKLYAVMTGK